MWNSHSDRLARQLSERDWTAVADAYDRVKSIAFMDERRLQSLGDKVALEALEREMRDSAARGEVQISTAIGRLSHSRRSGLSHGRTDARLGDLRAPATLPEEGAPDVEIAALHREAKAHQRVIDSESETGRIEAIVGLSKVGELLRKAGDRDGAAEISARLARLQAGDVAALHGEAAGYMRVIDGKGETGRAEAIENLARIGVLLSRKGDLAGAADIYEHLTQTDDKETVSKVNLLSFDLAGKLLMAGELTRAAAIFQRLMDSGEPERASQATLTLFYTGTKLLEAGKVDAAADAFRRVADSGDPKLAVEARSALESIASGP
jgi:tetratricopeptide (TPR) repeat protein